MSGLRRSILVLAALAIVAVAVACGGAIHAQDAPQDDPGGVLHGHLRHGGGADEFDPTAITVSLDVFEGIMDMERASTQPDASGYFEFPVTPGPDRLYFLTVEYQGARYSASRAPADLHEPVLLEVFEATGDSNVLTFEAHNIIVTGAVRNEGFLEVWERAVIRNDSGMTLVPDRDSPEAGMPGFLRFGLPRGYYNLDVSSTLAGGGILEVDRGFAIDTPMPPTGDQPYEFDFVYRVPYDSPQVDLSRVMRFGAERLFIAVPVDVARPSAPLLEDLGAAESEGRLLRILSGRDVGRGDTLQFTLSDLPMPSAWTRFTRSAGSWYLRIGAPALVAFAALGLLGLALRQRGPAGRLPAGLGPDEQRQMLVARVADLEDRRDAGKVSPARYRSEREELKRALMSVELRMRLQLENPQS